MDVQAKENRKEIRYPVQAEVVVERASGEKIVASTVNISGGGLLLNLPSAVDFEVGETVTCGVKLYAQKPPQPWGSGRVVRVENSLIAIDFRNAPPRGHFEPAGS
ncbi:MAG TPA: PilZ domain-containing protein [Bryobacteraceae bacterium]|nr:PilZ domain-containing protein [Bryobacteraceae bacterium]